jgi:hypothetical protein
VIGRRERHRHRTHKRSTRGRVESL